MSASRKITVTDWIDPDDAPDLSTPDWQVVIDATAVTAGRPKAKVKKISTTIRFSQDVLAALKADGKGWQTRADDLLRRSLGLGK